MSIDILINPRGRLSDDQPVGGVGNAFITKFGVAETVFH